MNISRLLPLALVVCVACGGGGGGGSKNNRGPKAKQPRQEETVLQSVSSGTYYSILRPVNFQANGYIPYGAATFIVEGDKLSVSTSMDDDQAVMHRQSVHLGTKCPTLEDDSNGDGFVDYNEALEVVGQVMIPLDGDLNAQDAGGGIYPQGRAMTYNRSGSIKKMNEDLWNTDHDLRDEFLKLPRTSGLGLEQRVVLIHGTTSQSYFPMSLSSREGEAANISLPVVCGVLERI